MILLETTVATIFCHYRRARHWTLALNYRAYRASRCLARKLTSILTKWQCRGSRKEPYVPLTPGGHPIKTVVPLKILVRCARCTPSWFSQTRRAVPWFDTPRQAGTEAAA